MGGSPWVSLAARVYAVVLSILPADLVAEHGAEARSDFLRVACAAQRRSGGAAVLRILVSASLDVIRRMPAEHWHALASGHERRMERSGPAVGHWRAEHMKDLMSEMLQSARSLSRRPTYAAAAILTLGLGIGANVTIFTVVNSVLLRPLAYPESERIVKIRHHAPGLSLPELASAPGLIGLYRDQSRTLQSITATDLTQSNLTGIDRPARVLLVEADVEFFDVFATRPAMGRAFTSADCTKEAAAVAILMHDAWQSRFGGDPSIVGRRIELDGRSTEVVGVMPAGFRYPDPSTVALVPSRVDPRDGLGGFGVTALARIAPGTDLEAAQAEIRMLQGRIPEVFPDLTQSLLDGAGWSVSVDRLRDLMVGEIERALWVLFGTVGLVLLIACANVANLFLVRAESRQREVAIRSALGANRRRLASTFISESLLIAVAGGMVATLLTWSGVRLLIAADPTGLPRLNEIGLDGSAAVFTLVLSLIAGIGLGMIPLAGRRDTGMATSLREGGRTATAGRRRYRARNLLIMSQVAMALVLLAASGLMLRSVIRLSGVDSGMDPDGVLTVGIAWGSDADRQAATGFYDRVLAEIVAIPGVESAGGINALPLTGRGLSGGSFNIQSSPRSDDAIPPTAMYSVVTPGFFETVGIALIAGRYPEQRDHLGGPPVVWISEKFAHEQFPDGALGERIRFGDDTVWAEIAGVVSDVRTFGLREDVRMMAYYPLSTAASVHTGVLNFAIRTRSGTTAILPAIRAAVARVDPDVPLASARTMDEVIASSMAEMSFTMVLLAIAAAVAVLLGAIGLYGVISWVVAQRTHEMGIRIALGARPADVLAMVVRHGMIVTIAGIVVGLVCALAATRLLSSLLYDVSAWDPLTFAAVPLVLMMVGLLAAWLPARRAAAADPLTAMRTEG